LERGDVNPDQVDTFYGRTPLSWAAENGHEGVVKMLLERGDVNPNQADTEFGRTPLSWAAENGHDVIVNILMEQKNVCTPTPDSMIQTPPRLVLPEGRDRVARIPQEQGNLNCAAVDCVGPTSLPPSTLPRDECAVKTQFRPHDPDTNMTDFDRQSPTSVVYNEQPRLPDLRDSFHNAADSEPSAQLPRQSQPPSIWLLRLCCRPRKNKTNLNNT